MDTKEMFATALRLEKPWYISKIEFTELQNNSNNRGRLKREEAKLKAATKNGPQENELQDKAVTAMHHMLSGIEATGELHIYIDYERGSKFPYPNADADSEVLVGAYDDKQMTWRHLNFWQYKTYIHANVPRVGDKARGLKPRKIEVPWARNQSGFTLLFESFIVELTKYMPPANVAAIVGENDTRLWRIIRHYVGGARAKADYSKVTKLGVDETSKKGQKYVTVFANLETRKVLYVTEGKDQTTVERFASDFSEHQGNCKNIDIITCDMSLGFKAGIAKHLLNATTVIDKFHVIKHANEAVDTVRKAESKENNLQKELLKKTKYIWLKNDANLTEKQRAKKEVLLQKHLKTGRACMMREELQSIYESSDGREEAEAAFKKLCSWIMHSKLEPMKKFCKMLREHWNEILNYFDNKYTNAILEGINSIIQNIKRRARGFRNEEYFETMIYLVCGEIDIDSLLVWN